MYAEPTIWTYMYALLILNTCIVTRGNLGAGVIWVIGYVIHYYERLPELPQKAGGTKTLVLHFITRLEGYNVC